MTPKLNNRIIKMHSLAIHFKARGDALMARFWLDCLERELARLRRDESNGPSQASLVLWRGT